MKINWNFTARTLVFVFISPVPRNVIARETEERPLIHVNTANEGRRPNLSEKFFFFFF